MIQRSYWQSCQASNCKVVFAARQQSGQALVYGLFMLMAGVAALYFLFNVGQLTQEKTKLVNTSDAVAYSAGIMHARAMNYMAYTNRAMVADEVTIAQAVSLASWGKYLEEHGQSAMSLGCNPENYYISEPALEMMLRYAPICSILGTAAQAEAITTNFTQGILGAIVIAAEASKKILQLSQAVVKTSIWTVRASVMQEVADANYAGDGDVTVEFFPIRDMFMSVGSAPSFIKEYKAQERTRMREFEVDVVNKDGFTPLRSWSDRALVVSCVFDGVYFNRVTRDGGTQLIGFDEWRAADQASYHRWRLETPKDSLPSCDESDTSLGKGNQRASTTGTTDVESDNWEYSGVPSYFDLTEEGLAKIDPRVQFAIRVYRKADQTRTSDGRSAIRTTPRLNRYTNGVGGDIGSGGKAYVGLAASETFFERPTERGDGKKELASLFNPYWQTHLMEVPSGARQQAMLEKGVVLP